MTTQNNQDIDLFHLQEMANSIARAEYEESYLRISTQSKLLAEKMRLWEDLTNRIAKQTDITSASNETLDEFLNEAVRLVKIGQDFEKILAHINGNEILQSQWNRLMMSMRLVGGN